MNLLRRWANARKRYPERIIADANAPRAVTQLIDILNEELSRNDCMHLVGGYAGIDLEQQDGILLKWKAVNDGKGQVRDGLEVGIRNGHIDEEGARSVATIMRHGIIRSDMLLEAGFLSWHEDPAWAALIPRIHRALVEMLQVHCDDMTGDHLHKRLENAVRHKGGQTSLEMSGHVISGMISMPADGQKHVEVRGCPMKMGVVGISLPQTTLTALAGRSVDDLVKIGSGCPDVIIVEAEMTAPMKMEAKIVSPLVALSEPPEEIRDTHRKWMSGVEQTWLEKAAWP